MDRVLVVVESEELQGALRYHLQLSYEVYLCEVRDVGAELSCRQYDALILELYLSGTDGLTLLKNAPGHRPPVILMLTPFITPYISRSASELGVSFLIREPCTALAVLGHLEKLLDHLRVLQTADREELLRSLLTKLGIPPKLDGFRLLQTAISLYARDPSQLIVKDLYPAVARIAGCSTGSVENSIRRAITAAWRDRDEALWQEYFPNAAKCPTNKEFLSTLASLLK